MRKVIYQFADGTETTNYDLAQARGGYKVRLDEIIPEVDPKEVKYRAENIAKKDAIRAAKRAAAK